MSPLNYRICVENIQVKNNVTKLIRYKCLSCLCQSIHPSSKKVSMICHCGSLIAVNFDDKFGKEARLKLEKALRPPKSRWQITTLGILLLGFYALWIAYGILWFLLRKN
jgi:hypothetical protein